MIYEFNGYRPVVHPSSFVHPQASVIGNVIIGRKVYVGPGAAIRGDWGEVLIEDGCNVQENCVIHMFPGLPVHLHPNAHIGHGAVLHGVTVGRNSLIGMNAVLMDNVQVGKECIVGALSFIKAEERIPDRSLVVGNPARIVREVSDEMIAWKREGTQLYQQLPAQCHESLRPCQPLTEVPDQRPKQAATFAPWKQLQAVEQ